MTAPGRPRPPAAPERAAGLVAVWCALWLVIGAWAGYQLWQLADLGTTVADSGRALDSAGQALQELREAPFVGDSTAEVGDEVRRNAADIVSDASDARGSLRQLAVLVGLTLALLPSVPAVVGLQLLRRTATAAAER